MDRADRYKQRHLPFGGAGGRMIRAQKIADRRKEQRAEQLSRFRNSNIVKNDSSELESQVETQEDRLTRLKKWKADRKLQKELEAKNKQPVFKVGIPHGNLFSLKSNNSPVPHCHRKKSKQCTEIHPAPPKRVTRATEKRRAAKQASLFGCLTNVKSNGPQTTRISEGDGKPKNNIIETEKVQSIAPSNYEFKGPCGIDPIPMFGRIWIPLSQESDHKEIQSLKQLEETTPMECETEGVKTHQYICDSIESIQQKNIEKKDKIDETLYTTAKVDIEKNNTSIIQSTEKLNKIHRSSPVPAAFSPFIITKRGKSSARKEQRMRLGLNDSMNDIIPTKDTVMQNLNISIEEEEKTAQYYKILLNQQIDKLTDLCAKWEKIQSEPETTEDGKYMINQAIGQTNLLIQKKFGRFRGLVSDCETGKGEMLVRCRDLQAFWDIILTQIKDCDLRFDKLADLKEKNWIEEDVQESNVEKKPTVHKKKKILAKSNVRAFIEAARKKKLVVTSIVEEDKKMESECTPPRIKNSSTPQSKTRSSKQMEKLLDTSFTVIKVSRMGKTPEIKLDSTISYVNSNQTPGRGILKRSTDKEKDGTFQKLAHKVNFNETISTSKESNDKMDVVSIQSVGGAEKRLDFDNESFNEENQDITQANIGINSFTSPIEKINQLSNVKYENEEVYVDSSSVLPIIEATTFTENTKKTPKKLKEQLFDTPINDSSLLNTRVLRNRSVITDNSQIMKCRPIMEKNNSVGEPHENMNDDAAKEKEIYKFKQRRSTRRSVKFDVEEDCTVCATTKSVLPATPRRNRKLSFFGDENCHKSIQMPSTGDLISFDSPITPRRRSKRVSRK